MEVCCEKPIRRRRWLWSRHSPRAVYSGSAMKACNSSYSSFSLRKQPFSWEGSDISETFECELEVLCSTCHCWSTRLLGWPVLGRIPLVGHWLGMPPGAVDLWCGSPLGVPFHCHASHPTRPSLKKHVDICLTLRQRREQSQAPLYGPAPSPIRV